MAGNPSETMTMAFAHADGWLKMRSRRFDIQDRNRASAAMNALEPFKKEAATK